MLELMFKPYYMSKNQSRELEGESVLYVSNEYYPFMAWLSWQHLMRLKWVSIEIEINYDANHLSDHQSTHNRKLIYKFFVAHSTQPLSSIFFRCVRAQSVSLTQSTMKT